MSNPLGFPSTDTVSRTSYNVTGLTPGTSYQVSVAGIAAESIGPEASIINVVTSVLGK